MANLEWNVGFVIRTESFTLEQTNEGLLASDWFKNNRIGWGYGTACTCVEACNSPFKDVPEKFTNIDFCLKYLPLKDDESMMSEM